jgi:hypothetical protein
MKKLLAVLPLFVLALPLGCAKKPVENAAPAAATPAAAAMPACCSMEGGVHKCQHPAGGQCCASHATK